MEQKRKSREGVTGGPGPISSAKCVFEADVGVHQTRQAGGKRMASIMFRLLPLVLSVQYNKNVGPAHRLLLSPKFQLFLFLLLPSSSLRLFRASRAKGLGPYG